jgi:uncharacterized lipoprotein YajG
MKKILFSLVALLLFAGVSQAQSTGPVVTSASFLDWDYDAAVTGVTGFRV